MDDLNVGTDVLDSQEVNPSGIVLTSSSIGFLNEVAKWTKFLSIVGFIGLGFMLVGAISINALPSSALRGAGVDKSLLSIAYLVMIVIYFFPIYYLFKFSNNMKSALLSGGSEQLQKAFEYLKSHYKYLGIVMIVILSLYFLMFMLGVIVAGSRGF